MNSVNKIAFLLEDEGAWRDLYVEWLEELGFTVYAAENLNQVDSFIQKNIAPSIACLDKNLHPERSTMDSGGITCALKLREHYPQTKIVMMTAYHESIKEYQRPIFDLICPKTKPDNTQFTEEDFKKAVKQTLNQH